MEIDIISAFLMSSLASCWQGSILLALFWSTSGYSADASVVNVTVADDGNGSGIEEEILGPLRVWHIVFIVVSILMIVMVIVCCCLDIRVPRTRQEIEHNYKKRLMNAKYLHALERTPDIIIQQHREEVAEENARLETISQMVAPKTLPKPAATAASRLRAAVERSRANARDSKNRRTQDNDGTGKRNGNPFKQGVGKALPVNPRDILALVAQQKKRNNQQDQ